MKTLIIKEFAKYTVRNGIKKEDAKKIIKNLSKKELEELLTYLKKEQEKETVYITSASELDRNEDAKIKDIFKGKRIIKKIDASLGGGINAQVYDMIYALSIKSGIESLVSKAQEEI